MGADQVHAAPSLSGPNPAVVRVVVPERDGASLGSGALVAVNESSGLVLTNWHVVRDAAGQITVIFPDGFRSGAYLLRTDREWDLAALAIRRPNVAPIVISTVAPRPGDELTIAGYGSGPYRAVTGRCTQYVSPGDNQPFEMIELSAPARNGDSGGPILNSRGELAGVLFGSSFGRTAGSYCGRLKWFLNTVDGDFRRISAQAMLARRSQAARPPLAAIPSAPPAAALAAASEPWQSPAPLAPVSDRGPSPRVDEQSTAPASATVSVWPQAAAATTESAAPTAAIPPKPAEPLPSSDQIKTILAAIGVIAVLYHAMRLLGRAVG